ERARAALHASVAAAILRVHGESPQYTQALAHHFHEAGDRANEARFSALAGEQALASAAYVEAVRHLERALALHGDRPPTKLEVTRWHRMIGEAHYLLGDLDRAVLNLEASITAAGHPLPASSFGWALFFLRQIVLQLLFWLLPGKLASKSERARGELREASSASGRLANLSTYNGDKPRVLGASLLSANLAERAASTDVYSLAVMGYSAGYLQMHGLARRYFDHARTAAESAHD